MPNALLLPILLRATPGLILLIAACTAGVLNRSVMIVPLLALAGTLAQFAASQFAPNPLDSLKDAFAGPKAATGPANKLARGLIMSTLGFGVVYGLSALIAALFQETEFARTLTGFDAGLVLIPAGIAFVLSIFVAKSIARQAAQMLGGFQAAFSQMQGQAGQAANDDDAFTVEGEIIDPKDEDL